jgi:hypothetical protein
MCIDWLQAPPRKKSEPAEPTEHADLSTLGVQLNLNMITRSNGATNKILSMVRAAATIFWSGQICHVCKTRGGVKREMRNQEKSLQGREKKKL